MEKTPSDQWVSGSLPKGRQGRVKPAKPQIGEQASARAAASLRRLNVQAAVQAETGVIAQRHQLGRWGLLAILAAMIALLAGVAAAAQRQLWLLPLAMLAGGGAIWAWRRRQVTPSARPALLPAQDRLRLEQAMAAAARELEESRLAELLQLSRRLLALADRLGTAGCAAITLDDRAYVISAIARYLPDALQHSRQIHDQAQADAMLQTQLQLISGRVQQIEVTLQQADQAAMQRHGQFLAERSQQR